MLEVRTLRHCPALCVTFLLLFGFSIAASGQDQPKNDESKEKASKKSGNFMKVEGKVRCEKPETEHAIDVPDRPGHVLILTKRQCKWSEPLVFKGAKTKDGMQVDFIEEKEGTLDVNGFQTATTETGEKITWKTLGQVPAEKGPTTSKGRWSLMRGTGKLKGIEGGGTYDGKLDADNDLTLDFEGVYQIPERLGEKK